MTKAEEQALVAYPPRYAKCIIFPETTGADINTLKREAYQEGYEQAEKDLALTWEDMDKIIMASNIVADLHYSRKSEMTSWKQYCEEVLKRFKEAKK